MLAPIFLNCRFTEILEVSDGLHLIQLKYNKTSLILAAAVAQSAAIVLLLDLLHLRRVVIVAGEVNKVATL
jgi:hypothetical protein